MSDSELTDDGVKRRGRPWYEDRTELSEDVDDLATALSRALEVAKTFQYASEFDESYKVRAQRIDSTQLSAIACVAGEIAGTLEELLQKALRTWQPDRE